MGDTGQVPLRSFHEDIKVSLVWLLVRFNALAKHSPQGSSNRNLPRAVVGRSLVLASLLFEVLCRDASVSTSTSSPHPPVPMPSSLVKSDHLAASEMHNQRAPEIADRGGPVLLVQINSSAFTAETVS